jgi:hypothetical protein
MPRRYPPPEFPVRLDRGRRYASVARWVRPAQAAAFPRTTCAIYGMRDASGSSVLAIAFAAQARTSCPGGSGPPRQAAGAIHGASSSLLARRLPRSSNPPFAIYRLGSRSPASGFTCSTIPSPSFVFPVWSAKLPCCQKRRATIGSASATRCAGPTFGCAFRLRRTAQEGPAEPPQEGGRSEVKRSRVGSSNGEPRTESPLRGGEAGTVCADAARHARH